MKNLSPKRKYSLLLRIYNDWTLHTYEDTFFSACHERDRAKAHPCIWELRSSFGMCGRDIYDAVWGLRTPPSTLGLSHNGQGYYAARGSRSCLYDFYMHDGIRLVRTGWLRDRDRVSNPA